MNTKGGGMGSFC